MINRYLLETSAPRYYRQREQARTTAQAEQAYDTALVSFEAALPQSLSLGEDAAYGLALRELASLQRIYDTRISLLSRMLTSPPCRRTGLPKSFQRVPRRPLSPRQELKAQLQRCLVAKAQAELRLARANVRVTQRLSERFAETAVVSKAHTQLLGQSPAKMGEGRVNWETMLGDVRACRAARGYRGEGRLVDNGVDFYAPDGQTVEMTVRVGAGGDITVERNQIGRWARSVLTLDVNGLYSEYSSVTEYEIRPDGSRGQQVQRREGRGGRLEVVDQPAGSSPALWDEDGPLAETASVAAGERWRRTDVAARSAEVTRQTRSRSDNGSMVTHIEILNWQRGTRYRKTITSTAEGQRSSTVGLEESIL